MTEQEQLMRAIILNPEEDTPRLVYADWLDDHASDDHPHRAGHAAHIRAAIYCFRNPRPSKPFPVKWGDVRHRGRYEYHKMLKRYRRNSSDYQRLVSEWSKCDRESAWRWPEAVAECRVAGHPGVRFVHKDSWERGFPVVCSALSNHFQDWVSAVIRSFPITFVDFGDRRPDGGVWYREGHGQNRHVVPTVAASMAELPDDLFDLLPGVTADSTFRSFGSDVRAKKNLSEVAIRKAREIFTS